MNYILTNSMPRRRRKIFNRTAKVSDIDFVDMYDDISKDWETRARDLRSRRLARLERQSE